MAFKTNHKKSGGRQKGTPNRDRKDLLEMLNEKYPNYHPVIAMVKIAHKSKNEVLRFQAHKEVAKYIAPQLKSVEIKDVTTLEAFINMSPEERKATIEKLREVLNSNEQKPNE